MRIDKTRRECFGECMDCRLCRNFPKCFDAEPKTYSELVGMCVECPSCEEVDTCAHMTLLRHIENPWTALDALVAFSMVNRDLAIGVLRYGKRH